MPKFDQIAKLLGLGAFGAIGGFGVAYLGFIWLTTPSRTGGIDRIGAAVTLIAVGGVLLALIAVHVALGKQLLLLSQGRDKKHPL
jgi:apolipoprotein N-acyltransferase